MTRILGIIPARYASTRFPGKPLADIGGMSMIERVYRQVTRSTLLSRVVVATDNQEIYTHVASFGGQAVMTHDRHPSGTDRCYEAFTLLNEPFDYVMNIQGDEPFIQPDQIDTLAGALDGKTEIATLVKRTTSEEELSNPGEVKVVLDRTGTALYFSRAPIPHIHNTPKGQWVDKHVFYKHIGLYAYRTDVLRDITQLPVSTLEKAESLEQLRWLEHGYRIKVAETDTESLCIETPDDVQRALEYLSKHS
ncbi:MAG TPA: 3-deoxy-manno-octulosonate cytidylyltransferase [Cyclobacteriaceae bacterium]|jgi:3-deoxy-manno-octulosonate cytidylyltransferase (CMP-KDO synthetase)